MNPDTVPGYRLAMVLKPPETGNNAADGWDFLQNGHPWDGERAGRMLHSRVQDQ